MKTPTYSELAEKLSRSKGKFDKLASSTDPAERFTGERMGKSFDLKLETLFNVQESQKRMDGGSAAPSFRLGGDPTDPLKNPLITPAVKKMWDEFQFGIAPRVMGKPSYPQVPQDKAKESPGGELSYFTVGPVSHKEKGFNDAFGRAMLDAKYSPSTKGMFKDFFADVLPEVKLKQKWNTAGFERGALPEGKFEDSFKEAMFNSKWSTAGYERAKAPTGSFEEVFRRALKTPIEPSVPRETGGNAGGNTGGKVGGTGEKSPGSTVGSSTPATSSSQATSTPSQGFRFKPNSKFNVEYATPRIGAQPSLTAADKSLVGNRFAFSQPRVKKGGPSAMQIAEGVAPFLDNLANLMNPTPRVPVPSLLRTPQFETKFNIEPQIQEMRRGLRTMGQQVDRSVGQGNVAAAYKAKGLADYFRGVGSAYNQKENTERGLRNANAEAIANVDAANTQIMNNYRTQQMGRDEAERMRRIGLMNNLGEDFMTIRNDRLMKELDLDKFALLGNVFKDVIYSNPELKGLFEKQKSGGIYKKYGGKVRMKY